MSRYRTRSWRAFDPGAVSAPTARPAAAAAVRILGLDPGSRRTGYGVIERRGTDWVHVAHGCVTVAGAAASLPERVRIIFESLREIIAEQAPGEVAIERVFVNRNVDSALKLGQARGAALCAVPKGLPVFEYAPRAIKLALVGSGAAEKAQVAHMIRTLLGLEGRISPDAADALAVAICHAHSRRLDELLQRTAASARATEAAAR
jgi:crossover junction endodeoxyribonuclease RuvC